MAETMLAYVVRNLVASVGQRVAIAEETGVPYFTIAKIVQGKTVDPRVNTVQVLHDYFRKNEPKLKRAS